MARELQLYNVNLAQNVFFSGAGKGKSRKSVPATIVQGEWYSEALGRPTQITGLLPANLSNGRLQPGRKLKTIYLLPGALSHSEAVLTEMNLASYFEGFDFADIAIFCVTPTFSYYVDYQKEYRYAHQYFTFMTRELIEQTRTLFPLSDKREDTAIYGCSVGGYGAYYCGLNSPDVYGHVGAQSGMLDMKWAIEARPFMTIKHQRQFGDNLDISGKSYDLFHVAAELDREASEGRKEIPRLFQSWGEEDYLAVPNENMHAHLKSLKNLDYTYKVIPGPHGWGIHNEGVNLFLDWFLADQKKGDEESWQR